MKAPSGNQWLPVSSNELEQLGWEQADVIIVSGDAYVDHPSFGPALIARIIEAEGFKVAVNPQPNWRDDLRDFKKLGVPRYFFGVTAGNMDSMVNHYTAAKRLRSDDAYTPGGKAGFRPDYATVVYTHTLKKLFPEIPVIIGGIEASMRRISHYDYWSDSVKPSILIESGANLLIYGMAERVVADIMQLFRQGNSLNHLYKIPQIAYTVPASETIPETHGWKTVELPSHEEVSENKMHFAKAFRIWEECSNRLDPARIVQRYGDQIVVINPPFPVLNNEELDRVYDLPFTRQPHPRYMKRGAIPAYEMIRNSITIHRGCFGGCSFCTISGHQGRFIGSRTAQSVTREINKIASVEGYSGHLTDLGGPTANMYRMTPFQTDICIKCRRRSCIFPSVCKNLNTSHQPVIDLYRRVRSHPAVKRATIGSGVRYDLFVGYEPADRSASDYLSELMRHHVSGRLKVAPEHTSAKVLNAMRKPPFKLFVDLKKKFDALCQKHKLDIQLIPYFISSHPGSTMKDMEDLYIQTRALGYRLEQVQDFTPTPSTLATAMFYTGIDPYTLNPVSVARTIEQKKQQHNKMLWYEQHPYEKQKHAGKMIKTRGRKGKI